MTLGALPLLERPLALALMAAHALLVESVHAAQEQLVATRLMADDAVGIQWGHLAARFGGLLPHGLHIVAGRAAVDLLGKQIFMAGHAAGVHGIREVGRRTGLGGLVRGRCAGFMAVGAVLGFGLDPRILVVTVPAIKAHLAGVPLVAPVLAGKLVVMTGDAGLPVIAGDVFLAEALVKGQAVTLRTGAHGGRLRPGRQAVVMTGAARHVGSGLGVRLS